MLQYHKGSPSLPYDFKGISLPSLFLYFLYRKGLPPSRMSSGSGEASSRPPIVVVLGMALVYSPARDAVYKCAKACIDIATPVCFT